MKLLIENLLGLLHYLEIVFAKNALSYLFWEYLVLDNHFSFQVWKQKQKNKKRNRAGYKKIPTQFYLCSIYLSKGKKSICPFVHHRGTKVGKPRKPQGLLFDRLVITIDESFFCGVSDTVELPRYTIHTKFWPIDRSCPSLTSTVYSMIGYSQGQGGCNGLHVETILLSRLLTS